MRIRPVCRADRSSASALHARSLRTLDILLCDEATSALDPETTQAILALLRDINRRLKLTVVLITHEMQVIRDVCDTVAVIERGRVVETGPVWRVFGEPQHDATRALLRTLVHDLPADLAERVKPLADIAQADARVLLDVRFTGDDARDPDLAGLASALSVDGSSVSFVHGGIDRIQGTCARAPDRVGASARKRTRERAVRRSPHCSNARAATRIMSRCWAMLELWLSELVGAIRDTVLMVGISALIAALVGIPLALVLVTTTRGRHLRKARGEQHAGRARQCVPLDAVHHSAGRIAAAHALTHRHDDRRVGSGRAA